MCDGSECRRLAAECLEMAERLSNRTDRATLMKMAQRWLEMAQRTEPGPARIHERSAPVISAQAGRPLRTVPSFWNQS